VSARKFLQASQEAHRSAGILKDLLAAAPLAGGDPDEMGEVDG
jgi:hypothetical protein